MSVSPRYAPSESLPVCLAPGVEMAFRYIPSGEFRMGSRSDRGWPAETEQPSHRVTIAEGFWLGETPVTQTQFALWAAKHAPTHRNAFPDRPDHPAESMTWGEAVRFCDWLTEPMAGQFPAGANLACLPTEAEWEYACRAGTETDYFTGDGEAALAEAGRFNDSYEAGTCPVRRGAKNAFGLHDLHGHVWQWCHDAWDRAAYRRRVDGDIDPGVTKRWADYESAKRWNALLEDGQQRAFRGGAWFIRAAYCRSAFRRRYPPGDRFGYVGFRVCLAPGPAERKTEAEQAEAAGGRERRRPARPESSAADAAGAGGENEAVPDLAAARLPRRK